MNEMKIGQSVIYRPAGGMQYHGQELAALVTKVHETGTVNLVIFDPFGRAMYSPPQHIKVANEPGCCYVVEAENCVSTVATYDGTAATPPGNPPFTDELPPGAKLVENRPATAEEISAMKMPPLETPGDISTPSPPKKPIKKPIKKKTGKTPFENGKFPPKKKKLRHG